MADYKTIETSAEVWAVIHAKHGDDLKPFGSYSHPMGDPYGDSSIAKMFTSYGFDSADYPIMEHLTTWEVSADPDKDRHRPNMKIKYWLCIPIKEDD